MNKILACMFPETQPDADFLFPLLQVFDQVVHMQAVENEPLGTRSSFVEHCMAQGRLQAFSPSPLGDQRQRFMALVEDMQRHGADYISQLSMLTLAGLHRRNDQRESSRALVADLLQRTNIREQEEEQLLLWQSRLVLKLGEWHDQQQADIDNALHHITSRQGALLQELREEEEDDPFSLTTELSASSREAETLFHQRIKAWCRLFWHDQVNAPGLLVTRQSTFMDLLHEVYEKQYRKPGNTVATLELPVMTPDKTRCDKPLIEQFPELQQAMAQLAGPVSVDLAKDIKEQFNAHAERWQSLLDQRFPAGATHRYRLELVSFPEISCRRLLLESFAGGVRSGNQENAEPEKGCCLGLLRKV